MLGKETPKQGNQIQVISEYLKSLIQNISLIKINFIK